MIRVTILRNNAKYYLPAGRWGGSELAW